MCEEPYPANTNITKSFAINNNIESKKTERAEETESQHNNMTERLDCSVFKLCDADDVLSDWDISVINGGSLQDKTLLLLPCDSGDVLLGFIFQKINNHSRSDTSCASCVLCTVPAELARTKSLDETVSIIQKCNNLAAIAAGLKRQKFLTFNPALLSSEEYSRKAGESLIKWPDDNNKGYIYINNGTLMEITRNHAHYDYYGKEEDDDTDAAENNADDSIDIEKAFSSPSSAPKTSGLFKSNSGLLILGLFIIFITAAISYACFQIQQKQKNASEDKRQQKIQQQQKLTADTRSIIEDINNKFNNNHNNSLLATNAASYVDFIKAEAYNDLSENPKNFPWDFQDSTPFPSDNMNNSELVNISVLKQSLNNIIRDGTTEFAVNNSLFNVKLISSIDWNAKLQEFKKFILSPVDLKLKPSNSNISGTDLFEKILNELKENKNTHIRLFMTTDNPEISLLITYGLKDYIYKEYILAKGDTRLFNIFHPTSGRKSFIEKFSQRVSYDGIFKVLTFQLANPVPGLNGKMKGDLMTLFLDQLINN